MSQERLVLKGRLGELRQRKLELATKAAGIINALRGLVMPLEVVPLEEMETGQVASLAGDLDSVRTQYAGTMRDIRKLERELE